MLRASFRASTAQWFAAGASSFGESVTRKSANARLDRGENAPSGVGEAGRRAETEMVRLVDVPALRVAADRRIDRLAEAPAEIATGRERSERTLPPEWWMGGSDCGGDV